MRVLRCKVAPVVDIGEFHDLPALRQLDGTMLGRVRRQGPVNAPPMIEVDVALKGPAQVLLVQDDDIVQALSAQCTDHPLRVRILPRASRPGSREPRPEDSIARLNAETLGSVALIDRPLVSQRKNPQLNNYSAAECGGEQMMQSEPEWAHGRERRGFASRRSLRVSSGRQHAEHGRE